MQLELERLSAQANRLKDLYITMSKVPIKTSTRFIQLGSLIKSNDRYYYIAVGIGKLKIMEQPVFVVSPVSPIGQVLLKRKLGDQIKFRNQLITIDEIL